MIANDLEYEITTEEIARFEKALIGFEQNPTTDDPILRKVMYAALATELQILREQAAAYEATRGVAT